MGPPEGVLGGAVGVLLVVREGQGGEASPVVEEDGVGRRIWKEDEGQLGLEWDEV